MCRRGGWVLKLPLTSSCGPGGTLHGECAGKGSVFAGIMRKCRPRGWNALRGTERGGSRFMMGVHEHVIIEGRAVQQAFLYSIDQMSPCYSSVRFE